MTSLTSGIPLRVFYGQERLQPQVGFFRPFHPDLKGHTLKIYAALSAFEALHRFLQDHRHC
jgi:hypothetical protein